MEKELDVSILDFKDLIYSTFVVFAGSKKTKIEQ
jgi:hypothetical protein